MSLLLFVLLQGWVHAACNVVIEGTAAERGDASVGGRFYQHSSVVATIPVLWSMS